MVTSKIETWKTTKINPELHAILKSEAALQGMAMADLLEIIVADWIRKRGVQLPPARRIASIQADLLRLVPPDVPDD